MVSKVVFSLLSEEWDSDDVGDGGSDEEDDGSCGDADDNGGGNDGNEGVMMLM